MAALNDAGHVAKEKLRTGSGRRQDFHLSSSMMQVVAVVLGPCIKVDVVLRCRCRLTQLES
jgi:hypothetical protein